MAERKRTRGDSSAGSRGSGEEDRQSKTSPEEKGAQREQEEERILGTAPSSPDIRKLQLMEPSEEAKAHEPSTEDAMGKDKRRAVVGHSYGPSRRSQVMFFVAVGAIIAVLVGGYAAAISAFDQPPDEYPDKAPWSGATAKPVPTRSPSNPCGEPGNPFPPPRDSPCLKQPSGGSIDPGPE